MKQFYLPNRGQWSEVGETLLYHHNSNETDHYQKRVSWTWVHYFLQGMRAVRLSQGSTPAGLPSPTYHDAKGRKRIRFEKALQQMKTEEGRLLKIDVAPAVGRRQGVGLSELREESISQALLDYFYRRWESSGLHTTAAYHLLAFGTVGLGVFPGESGPEPWAPSINIIPGWELRSVPANILGLHDLAGIEWHRWVPLKWLKSLHKKQKLRFPGKERMNKLGILKVPIGSRVETDAAPQPLAGMTGTASGAEFSSVADLYEGDFEKPTDRGMEEFVELREYFFYGSEHTMKRYTLMAGEWVLADEDYTLPEWQDRLASDDDITAGRTVLPIMPVHVCRYQEVGSFYGRSFIDRLLPLNRELEHLLGEAIDNMRKVDRMRKLFIPISGGVNERNLRINMKNSFVPVQPDYGAPQWKPFVPDIPNVGDAHGNIINMVGAMLGDIAAHGPLLEGDMPSRADSGISASIVGEFQAIPMAGTGEALYRCWTGAYRAVLSHVRNLFNSKLQPTGFAAPNILIQIGKVDESILGLAFDPRTGTVKLNDYTLPDPVRLSVSIRSKNPRPKEAVLESLNMMADTGRISPAEWEIGTILQGLDLPLVSKAFWHNYESAWMENIIMFGDGETPGTVETNEFGDNHPLHFMFHMELMATQAFKYASDAVQKKFVKHVQEYHRAKLRNVPDDMTTVDLMNRVAAINPGAMAATGAVSPGQAAMMPE